MIKNNKNVKLVFKDRVDIENLYLMGPYIQKLIKDKNCICYHIFNSYENEFEDILRNYLSKYTKSIKINKLHKKPNFLIYLKNYFKRVIYFSKNVLISNSAFHKLLEYFLSLENY